MQEKVKPMLRATVYRVDGPQAQLSLEQILLELLLDYGLLKKEIAVYLGVSVSTINRLLLDKYKDDILDAVKSRRLYQLHFRLIASRGFLA